MRPRTDSLLDTIAALATPAGRSALAVVRVSGRRTQEILSAVAPGLPESLIARHPYLASLADVSGDALDRGLVTFFAAPASATGEDVAEFSVHGSPIVIGRLLKALVCAGARLARPGEFTERAFLLGKVDLLEAQAVSDLIEARTETAARFSARRLEGRLSRRLTRLREDLLSAAAGLAATIDFAEDVGESLEQETLRLLSSAADDLTRLSASYETGRLLWAGCRVAILGRPNAGKSTLFNALVGSARAIVTDVPGTTRDTLEGAIDVAGIPIELVDTAGLRETEDPVEKIGVARAREAGRGSDAVLYVIDAGQGVESGRFLGPRGTRRKTGFLDRQQDRQGRWHAADAPARSAPPLRPLRGGGAEALHALGGKARLAGLNRCDLRSPLLPARARLGRSGASRRL